MENVPSIVEGEASESDSEQDVIAIAHVEKTTISSLPHGAVVVGEAPESDEEQSERKSVSTTPTNQPKTPVFREFSNSEKDLDRDISRTRDSLLQKKLRECNVSLRSNMVGLLKNTIQENLEQLSLAEQELIKSQMRLQSANIAMRSLSSSGAMLSKRLSISTAYIPHINISSMEHSAPSSAS